MPTVVIELTPGNSRALVYSPFEAKDIIKMLPYGRRSWDKENRCWLVDTALVKRLTGLLEGAEFTVQVITPDGAPHNGSSPPAARTWADQMYAALGVPLADLAFKALTRILHPDTGGNAEAMKMLNAARDHAHGRNHRH